MKMGLALCYHGSALRTALRRIEIGASSPRVSLAKASRVPEPVAQRRRSRRWRSTSSRLLPPRDVVPCEGPFEATIRLTSRPDPSEDFLGASPDDPSPGRALERHLGRSGCQSAPMRVPSRFIRVVLNRCGEGGVETGSPARWMVGDRARADPIGVDRRSWPRRPGSSSVHMKPKHDHNFLSSSFLAGGNRCRRGEIGVSLHAARMAAPEPMKMGLALCYHGSALRTALRRIEIGASSPRVSLAKASRVPEPVAQRRRSRRWRSTSSRLLPPRDVVPCEGPFEATIRLTSRPDPSEDFLGASPDDPSPGRALERHLGRSGCQSAPMRVPSRFIRVVLNRCGEGGVETGSPARWMVGDRARADPIGVDRRSWPRRPGSSSVHMKPKHDHNFLSSSFFAGGGKSVSRWRKMN